MTEGDVYNQSARESSDAERHSFNAFAKMNTFRKRGQLCDVVVKVGGRVFPAHRVVLAASSDYFGAMFSNGMAESAQLEIELKSVSADVMEALLDFVYTGQVRVSMENVQELLPAASLVQMEGVKTVCSAFLFGQVEASNVLGIRRFAELHSCTDLEIFAKNYAAHNFETVVGYEEFLLMTADELIELLSREDLHIDSEETSYNAVIRWVYYDEPNRAVHLPHLLNYVRLAIMSVRFLTDVVDNERLIRQSLECRDLVDEAKRFHLRPDLRSQMRQRRFHQRDCGDEYLVVIGGFGSYQSPSDSVEMFNPRTREWSELPNLPISYRYVAACSLGTCVYMIGGFDGGERLNTVGLLDVAQREDGWRWLSPMHYKRGLSAACTHKGLIYVCGGFDGQTRLRALEVYHPKIDEWRVLEEMTTAREGAGLVVADDTLFCLGGYDGYQLLNSMEAFDLRRGTWSQCKPMYMRRSGAGCAVIVDTMYVCGGYGGPEGRGPLHLDTVEAYNTRLAQWTLVANMNVPRCYVGACQLAGRVYVAAGYNGNRLLNTVEAFDPIDNTWTLYEESRMHNERCDTGMCVVRFLSCAEPPTCNVNSVAPFINQPRTVPYTQRPRNSTISSNNNGETSGQTQVVQIVTPLFQDHGARSTLPTPPTLPPLQSHHPALGTIQGHNFLLRHLPESTGAPPILGQRVMPLRGGRHEPTLTSVNVNSIGHIEESFLEGAVGESADLNDNEESSERNISPPTELLNVLEPLVDTSEIASVLPTVGNVGDGTGTSGVDLTFQHPDGAASEESAGLLLRLPSSDLNRQRIEDEEEGEEEEEDDDDEEEEEEDESTAEGLSTSPTQPLTGPPPGLGLILENIDAHLQRRMVFLRGRESSGSQNSLLAGNNRSGEIFEESRDSSTADGEHDPERLGRPPSPSTVPSSSTDSLIWIHQRNRHRHSVPSSASSPQAQVIPTSRSRSDDVEDEDLRSDGEGEEGEEGEAVVSGSGVTELPRREAPPTSLDLSPLAPSTPTSHESSPSRDAGD